MELMQEKLSPRSDICKVEKKYSSGKQNKREEKG